MAKPTIDVHTNAASLAVMFGELGRDQFPYATAQALTTLAFTGQKATKLEATKSFHLRNRYSVTGVQVNKAEKSQWPSPESEVGIDKGRSYLIDHVLGAVRKGGKFGRAIPVGEGLRSPSGRIAKAKRPKTLIRMGQRKGAGGRKKGSKNGDRGARLPFLIKVGKGFGNEVLVQRMGAERYPLAILYGFKKNVRVKQEFDMEGAVIGVVSRDYYRVLGKALSRAIATAKPKGERMASLSAGNVIDWGK